MKALVTGGGGFLGKAIVARLIARGDEVISFCRGQYPDVCELGAATCQGDLADIDAVCSAIEGCDAVFHVAAKAGFWGPYEEYYRPNVVGTRNVIDACLKHGISRLVYTSSPSVVHNGGSLEGVNEDMPYPEHFEAHYPKTKAEAEQLVLNANSENLATAALRPHLIWGPGENHMIPELVRRAKAGRLPRMKGGPYLVDSIYIDNAVDAHLLAMDKLKPGAEIGGKAYFISQGEPVDIGDLMDLIIGAFGLPPTKFYVSPKLAYALGWVIETFFSRMKLKNEPPMSRFIARQLATSHWFDISAAKRDLGYQPTISIKEGLEILKRELEQGTYKI